MGREENLRAYGWAPFQVAVIHGGPGAAGEMEPVARRLARERGVLEPMQTATSIEAQVDELRELLLTHATVPAVLVGFSWGAWLSLLLAARSPELVRKLILVRSGAFAESCAARMHATRLSRLDERERAEFKALLAALENPATPNKDALLAKLGGLAAKADGYAPIARGAGVSLRLNGDIYHRVWNEAAEMRRTGELLRRVRQVVCPVVAIHGDWDPSPAAGVAEPLSAALPNFRLVLLQKCGHTPWLERFARERFYRVLLAEL